MGAERILSNNIPLLAALYALLAAPGIEIGRFMDLWVFLVLQRDGLVQVRVVALGSCSISSFLDVHDLLQLVLNIPHLKFNCLFEVGDVLLIESLNQFEIYHVHGKALELLEQLRQLHMALGARNCNLSVFSPLRFCKFPVDPLSHALNFVKDHLEFTEVLTDISFEPR
jgi:hypothetical protein